MLLRRACGFFVALAPALLLPLGAGCSFGPAKGEVLGKVTFKDKPVTEGLVTFLNPKEGGAAEARLDSDGNFKVAGGVLVGEYVVVVTPPTEMKDTDPGKSPPAPVEKHAPNIPKKQRMQGTSTLRANVKTGKNDFHFELSR